MTQHERIMGYIEVNGSITPMEAFLQLGITKLSTRIGEMRKNGVNIKDEFVTVRNRFGEPVRFKKYWIAKSE